MTLKKSSRDDGRNFLKRESKANEGCGEGKYW